LLNYLFLKRAQTFTRNNIISFYDSLRSLCVTAFSSGLAFRSRTGRY